MRCKYCDYECPEKDWTGDDRVCGFNENGIFMHRNWRCAILDDLRLKADDWVFIHNHYDEHISVIPMPTNYIDYGDFVIVTWYKSRGRTEGVYISKDGIIKHADISIANIVKIM